MAVTLTASNSLTIQARIAQMWNAEGTQARRQYDNPTITATQLLGNQTMRFMPVMDNAGRCISWKIWWPDLTDLTASGGYVGTSPDSGLACDIATGPTIGTTSLTYSPNLYADEVFQISDDLCANDATFAELSAAALQQKMLELRKKINVRAINFLNTNASENAYTDPGYPDFSISGTTTTVPSASFDNANILMKFALTAQRNRIPNFLILDGDNLLLNEKLAPYLGLNDDTRSFGALFQDFRGRYSSDMLDMYSTLSESATFLANPNMVGYFNRTAYSSAMVELNPAKNMKAFKIADPVLKYRRTEVNQNGVITGTSIVPVEYDVLYQYACETARDANGRPSFLHKWEVKHEGGLVLGPGGNDGETGILKFVKDNGI